MGKTSFDSIETSDIHLMISAVRKGVGFDFFMDIVEEGPFSLHEWSEFLHLSDRTIQRYRKEKRRFDALQSERILQLAIIYKKGLSVFGNKQKFDAWLVSENIALGGVKPKSLLDNIFGISLLEEELTRIEQGILA